MTRFGILLVASSLWAGPTAPSSRPAPAPAAPLFFSTQGIGEYVDEAALSSAQAAPLQSPELAAKQYGERARLALEQVWPERGADILAHLPGALQIAVKPSVHQFCFTGLDEHQQSSIACGEVVFDTSAQQLVVRLGKVHSLTPTPGTVSRR